MRRTHELRPLPRLGAALAATLILAGCADNETTVARGDRLWADSNYSGALAEYRLAVAQRGDDAALARVAHVHVPDEILDPRAQWADKAAYDQQAETLARMFVENFRQGDAQFITAANPNGQIVRFGECGE